jgi:hypothetical protein
MTETRIDEILDTLRSLVRFDVRTLYDANNALKPVQLWPKEASLAVAAITSRELFAGSGDNRVLIGVEHSVKLSDRTRALQLAMTEAGLFAERLPPPADPAEMSDSDLIRTIEYHVIDGNHASRWETMTDAQIDYDFAKIVACYDERRPGAREHAATPPHAPVPPGQRLLPPPVEPPLPPAEPPPAPVEPDPPHSIQDWRHHRRYASPHLEAFDNYARATQTLGSQTYNYRPK